ncbi:Protein PTHB1 [Papilio machaon]|uniref:Protein PTHB1 n=1 Tax=Papilio machaon TaxID=76193 RepID=A0A194QQS4_PAPMA|nr:Protein PTHB1 [Papilio machaon]
MSLFKVKQWWSNTTKNTDNNEHSFSCMKVDKFNSHNDSDCILLGEGTLLKLFKPSLDQDGEQNRITAVIKHAFKRLAYNMTVGPFGSSKARDLICVQSLDGTLSFFDQDTFVFMCIFNDILIPGPVAYTSSNFSSIIALGERHLYCFQDNGLMKTLIRFDYTPICFHSYLIGWYYEPGARLLVMVASDDSKLYVYEGTKLLWACDLMMKAVSLSRCFINSLPGGVVTLYLDGMVSVNYLGTEPDLNPSVNIVNEIVSPVEVQRELESVEEALKLIISEDKDFTKEELSNFEAPVNNITFKYKTTNKTVTVYTNEQEYIIESDDYPEILSVLDHLLNKLNEYYIQTNIGVHIIVKPSKEFITQIIHRFLKSIETHAKERIKLKKLQDELNILQRQFTAVQKRLLVQYGSLPPADCDPLEFLMKDTHQRIINIVHQIIHNRNVVSRAGNTLAAIGRLIICILRNTSTDTLKVVLIEEMLSLDLLHDDCQEWEEAVTKVSSFVTNKLFKNSEKDREKLAPVTEQETLSHINLKRFLRKLKIILEKVFDEIKEDSTRENVVRTEELVEII